MSIQERKSRVQTIQECRNLVTLSTTHDADEEANIGYVEKDELTVYDKNAINMAISCDGLKPNHHSVNRLYTVLKEIGYDSVAAKILKHLSRKDDITLSSFIAPALRILFKHEQSI